MFELPVRGQVRAAGWDRLSHGLYLPASPTSARAAMSGIDPTRRMAGQPADEPFPRPRAATLAAWQLVLPPSAVFTHVTAAGVCNWWLPPLPDKVPVFAATVLQEGRPRREGIVVSRLTRATEPVTRAGLRLDSSAEVVLRLARDLCTLDTTVVLDSALRCGDVTYEEIERVCSRPRPGVRVLREALDLCDPRSESPWESVLRVFHVICEVPVEPQHEVRDEFGGFVARGDLWIVGSRVLHEYDGAVHRDRRTQQADLRRERRLGAVSWTRRGYTSRDLLDHAHLILREADATLDRPHRPARLRGWHAILRGSLFTPAGRRELQTKWNPVGLRDWSQTGS